MPLESPLSRVVWYIELGHGRTVSTKEDEIGNSLSQTAALLVEDDLKESADALCIAARDFVGKHVLQNVQEHGEALYVWS